MISQKKFFRIFFGKTEYNLKVKRCFLSFHHGKAKGFNIPPERISRLLRLEELGLLCIVKVCMQSTVNGKGCKGGDRGLAQPEAVKGTADKKLGHEIL